MSKRSSVYATARALLLTALAMTPAAPVAADTLTVPAGGDLQVALNAARPGDTILLEPGATYLGNFRLPVHGGTTYITIRSAAADALLPPGGTRMLPGYAPHLPVLRSPNSMPALRTSPGAAFWRLQFLAFDANRKGLGDIIMLGDGSTAQSTLDSVPHDLILDRLYIHGDPLLGQKRGIQLNSAQTTIVNSYIADIKAVGQDTQAIGGWNGPGPFRIENNYLESSTMVVLFGGDDPKIPGLVPSDIIIRNNTLTRPVSWRAPIVPAPTGVSAAAGSGGSLAAGTYGYKIVARRPAGTTTARSNATAEVTATVLAGGRVTLQWNPVPDATDYLVYGRTSGAVNEYWATTATTFVDDGQAGTSGTPGKGTVWQVKNLFELKNAQRVQVVGNVMENNWLAAQNGFAVLFTPRNQYGGCTWCVVRDVTFERNIVRHVAAAVSVLGQDYIHPTLQTTNIVVRNNEFSDVSRSWGGSGYFLNISDQPGKLVFDHNTIVSADGRGVITVAGAPISGFEFTNNVARHNSYGILGADYGYGNGAIAHYFPDGVITRNVLAGGKASLYPAGNEFPSIADFEAHFVDYAAADYALMPGTNWERAGTDGRDLGAEYAATSAGTTDVEPPRIVTTTLPPATELETYAAVVTAAGGTTPYRWRVAAGELPSGVLLDPVSGTVSGAASAPGDFTFIAEVTDAAGATATQPFGVHVEAATAPVSIVTSVLPDAVTGRAYSFALEASGGLGAYAWTLADGALPAGLALGADGTIAGVPAGPGTGVAVITATDAQSSARFATRTFTLAVEPPPNQPPAVSLSVVGIAPVGGTVVLTADAFDGDGFVQRVEFYREGAWIATATAAPFAAEWLVEGAGPHHFSAVAFDDDGATSGSAEAIVETTSEVVLYAADASRIVGNYALVSDTTAAAGMVMVNPNFGAAKVSAAQAAPATYVEFTFFAEAGRPYQLWLRGRAERNSWANDSIFIQFDGLSGAAIGTTSALTLTLEDDIGAGLAGWGWQDHGFGTGVIGAALVFDRTGAQTIRIQPREDGFSFDQIVLSPERYPATSPGALKYDATIVNK